MAARVDSCPGPLALRRPYEKRRRARPLHRFRGLTFAQRGDTDINSLKIAMRHAGADQLVAPLRRATSRQIFLPFPLVLLVANGRRD